MGKYQDCRTERVTHLEQAQAKFCGHFFALADRESASKKVDIHEIRISQKTRFKNLPALPMLAKQILAGHSANQT